MDLNRYIDYTNLKSTATLKDIEKLCDTAIKNNFYSVCVHPYYVSFVSKLLKNTNIEICTVVGFPLGLNTTKTKSFEAIEAIENGATEIDMMINMSALKNNDYEYIKEEIEEIRDSIDGKVLKVIIETCYLNAEEIKKMTEICNLTFINFIKTSTGFGTRGVSLEDIDIINKYKNEVLEIKASGGIKDFDFICSLIDKKVTRLGISDITNLEEKK
ncbi:MAG: deoxyribose-phosphate aldolase [Bacilli bacterium]